MDKLSAQQVCDSKVKHSEISAQYLVSNGDKGLSQGYYKCTICKHYHITTITKGVEKKRKNKKLNKFDRETYLALKNKLQRNGYRKRKK